MTQWKEAEEHAKRLVPHFPDYEISPNLYGAFSFTFMAKDGSGRGLYFNFQNGKKFVVSLKWPYDFETNEHFWPDVRGWVGVSMDKDPAKIAADIERRLLPGYTEEYAKQAERMNAAKEWRDEFKAFRDGVIASLGDTISHHQEESSQITIYRHGLTKLDFSRGQQGERIAIHTSSLPKEVALKVLDLLKQEMPATRY